MTRPAMAARAMTITAATMIFFFMGILGNRSAGGRYVGSCGASMEYRSREFVQEPERLFTWAIVTNSALFVKVIFRAYPARVRPSPGVYGGLRWMTK